MSATMFVVVAVIAAIAAGVWSLVTGAWSWRSYVAMFLFGLLLLLLPQFIHG